MVGRNSAALEDFRYSTPWSAPTWSGRKLICRVHPSPQAKVKGNRMPYGGLTDGKDVNDIIAYLTVLK